jgi:hypothetical protein
VLDNRYSILIYLRANFTARRPIYKVSTSKEKETKHKRMMMMMMIIIIIIIIKPILWRTVQSIQETERENEDEFQLSLCEDGAHRLSISNEGHNNTHTSHLGLKETCQLLFKSGGADVSVSKRWTGSIYPTESDIRKILSVLLLS